VRAEDHKNRIARAMASIFAAGFLLLAGAVPGSRAWAAEKRVIRVAAVGDVMMGTEGRLPPDDGLSLFAAAKPFLLPNDIVFCNHEGTLTHFDKPTKVPVDTIAYVFRTPPRYARYLEEAGFNMVSVANNHFHDYGAAGAQETMDVLRQHHIEFSGPPGIIARKTVNDLKTVMVAFHSSANSHWLLDIPKARQIVQQLAKSNDIVIVSFHGGQEGREALHTPREMEFHLGEPRGEIVRFARAVVEAGADLVLGHGPHVPRAMEIYRGRLIAYSLGNFCTGEGINVQGETGYAPLLLAELDENGQLLGGRIVSFYQTYGQPPVLDPQNRAARLMHRLGCLDFPDSNAMTEDGGLIPATNQERQVPAETASTD
jgi:hypothetical protein